MAAAAGLRGMLAGDLRTHEEICDAVYLFDGDAEAKQGRFWLLLVLSATIATAGIVEDSTATVIGAMIIAPLATPIQGVAVAIAEAQPRPLLRSGAILLAAVAVVIAWSALVAWILPTLSATDDNSQITSRDAPTLVDLFAAAATGAAGAFAIARRDIGDILPGVAIAISLVPPLAVVGVTGVQSDFTGAAGALLLFATNVLAIVVVGVAVFSGLRAVRTDRTAPGMRRARVFGVLVAVGAVIVGALAIATVRAVRQTTWRDNATAVGSVWAREGGERLLAARFDGDTLVLAVEGRGSPDRDSELPARLHGEVPSGTPVRVNRVAGQRREVGAVP
jgi:uncharacterized hydrophobic protein (TIGR00271 family)